MSRGVEGREIFHDDADRTTFLRMLRETKRAHNFRLFAYCLMGNHFHFLLQVETSPLYSSMHRLLTRYSCYFNQRHNRQGHLFQSRYTAPMCRRDSYLENLLRYIHLNPVRAGLVREAEDWNWSGHLGLSGAKNDSLLDLEALAEMRGQNISALQQGYLKSLEVPADAHGELALSDLESSAGKDALETPSIKALLVAAAQKKGVNPHDICNGHRGKIYTQVKIDFILKAARCGYRLAAMATELKCSSAAVTLLRKRKS